MELSSSTSILKGNEMVKNKRVAKKKIKVVSHIGFYSKYFPIED
jgi:hypothetical protein